MEQADQIAQGFAKMLDSTADESSVHREIEQFCRINLQNLDEVMERHPGLYAYAVACFEMAKVREAQRKWDRESAEASAFQIFMDQGKDSKMTATAAAQLIKTVPGVVAAVKAHHEAMVMVARFKGLTEGLVHRRDMIVQISAKLRSERFG